MVILSYLHSANRGALQMLRLSYGKAYRQDSVPVPCQRLSVPILAYAHGPANLDCVSLKHGRSLYIHDAFTASSDNWFIH